MQRPFRRKWVSEPPRAAPPPSRPSSVGSAAAMEPAGLEQILRELLLPDTERIRQVRGRRGRSRASGRLRERTDCDPSLPQGHGAAPDRSSGPRRSACALRLAGLGGRPSGEAPAPSRRASHSMPRVKPQFLPGPSRACFLVPDPPVRSFADPQTTEHPLATARCGTPGEVGRARGGAGPGCDGQAEYQTPATCIPASSPWS